MTFEPPGLICPRKHVIRPQAYPEESFALSSYRFDKNVAVEFFPEKNPWKVVFTRLAICLKAQPREASGELAAV